MSPGDGIAYLFVFTVLIHATNITSLWTWCGLESSLLYRCFTSSRRSEDVRVEAELAGGSNSSRGASRRSAAGSAADHRALCPVCRARFPTTGISGEIFWLISACVFVGLHVVLRLPFLPGCSLLDGNLEGHGQGDGPVPTGKPGESQLQFGHLTVTLAGSVEAL